VTHLLVLQTDKQLLIPDVGRTIARALHRPLADVTRLLRGSRGVIDLGVDEHQASLVADVLEPLGIRARVFPATELPALPAPSPLYDADPTPNGLDVQLVTGTNLGSIPWKRLHIMAVGLVTFETQPGGALPVGEGGEAADLIEAALTGMMLSWGYGSFSARPTRRDPPRGARPPKREIVHCLDLLLSEPGQRLRVLASRFVYDYLGDRLALSSVPNFRQLVEDIAGYAPEALLSGSTLSFLEGGTRATGHRFTDPGEFEAYQQWLLAWPLVWGE